jgi:hypothetical protein
MRPGLCAIFRPPTVSVTMRTSTSGATRNGRRARDAGQSSVAVHWQVAAHARTDACRLVSARMGAIMRLEVRGRQVDEDRAGDVGVAGPITCQPVWG